MKRLLTSITAFGILLGSAANSVAQSDSRYLTASQIQHLFNGSKVETVGKCGTFGFGHTAICENSLLFHRDQGLTLTASRGPEPGQSGRNIRTEHSVSGMWRVKENKICLNEDKGKNIFAIIFNNTKDRCFSVSRKLFSFVFTDSKGQQLWEANIENSRLPDTVAEQYASLPKPTEAEHKAQKAWVAAEAERKAQEARVAAEAERKAREARVAAEAERRKAQESRVAAETERKAQEARIAAETERRKAQEARVAAETERKAREARIAAETERRKAQEARIAAETERRKAKEARIAAEAERKAQDTRIAAETERKAREARVAAETERKAREARIAAETERRKAQEARIAAETKRKAQEAAETEQSRLAAIEKRLAAIERERQRKIILDEKRRAAAEAEQKRLSELETKRKAEEKRLAAIASERKRRLEEARLAAEIEAKRLAELELKRKAEEARLALIEAERKRKVEETRLTALEEERKRKEEETKLSELRAERKRRMEEIRLAAEIEKKHLAELALKRKAEETQLALLETERKRKVEEARLSELKRTSRLVTSAQKSLRDLGVYEGPIDGDPKFLSSDILTEWLNKNGYKDIQVLDETILSKLAAYASKHLIELAAQSDAKLRAENESRNNSVAVVIGNKNYKNASIPSVAYAHNDAAAVRKYLIDVLGYRTGNIIFLKDSTQAELQSVFGNFVTHKGRLWRYVKKNQSQVTIFYSGHGVPGLKDRRGYILPVDADPEVPELNGISLDIFYQNLTKLQARSVFVYLDACFSGESNSGTLVKSTSGITVVPRLPEVPKGMVVLTAAKADQVASWDKDNRHGLFTYHLLSALYGEADKIGYGDRNGTISLEEAKTYLDKEMSYASRRLYGREQNVSMRGDLKRILGPVPTISNQDFLQRKKRFTRSKLIKTAGAYKLLKTANIRSRPNLKSEKVAILNISTVVRVTGKTTDGKWFRIDHNGDQAFIWSDLIKPLSPE